MTKLSHATQSVRAIPFTGQVKGMGWRSARFICNTIFFAITLLPLLATASLSQEVTYSSEKCAANDACQLLMNGRPDYSKVEAEVVEVVDADSLRLKLHLLPGLEYTVVVRSFGVDTPEIRGPKCDAERELGLSARNSVANKFAVGRWVYLENIEYDKYGGRILADIYRWDSDRAKSLTKELIETEQGVPYSGEGPRHDWCMNTPGAANDNG